MKCYVYGCENETEYGPFVGPLCGPCYEMLTTGKYNPSKAWFIQEIDSLRTQFADCRVRHEMQRIENDKLQDDISILERNISNLAADKAFLARALRLAHETIDNYKDKLGDMYTND